jgi:HSP20 family protein
MNRTMVPTGGLPGRMLREGGTSPFLALQQGINRVFDDMWRGLDLPAVFGPRFPSIELRDEDKEIRVVAELPGLDEKDVEISLKDGILLLSGDKKSETSESTEQGTFSERWYGHFERAVAVGEVDEEKVAAEFKNGVLTVILPKAEQAKETGRKIPIGK